MRILFNFSTLKAGGGQNVGLNFLHTLIGKGLYERYEKCFFLVARGSAIERFVNMNVEKECVMSVSENPVKRLGAELFSVRQFIKRQGIDIIYSYFGYGLFSKKIPQVTGSAVSNIYFPEINFWEGYKGLSLWKRKLVDKYREWGMKRSAGVVFETELLERRCHKLFSPDGLTKTIRPSIFTPKEGDDFVFPAEVHDLRKGLFLCGWQRNKQVMLIPEIAACLKERKVPFLFVLTAPLDESPMHRAFVAKVNELGVSDYVFLSNVVDKPKLKSLYNQVDFVFLLSKLESFSNNIIEAWTYEKPLVASDEEWTHSICDNAAVYVQRDNPEQIANVIEKCLKEPDSLVPVVSSGMEQLAGYPTIEERTEQELEFIEQVYAQSH